MILDDNGQMLFEFAVPEDEQESDNLKRILLMLFLLMSDNEEYRPLVKPYVKGNKIDLDFKEISTNKKLKPLFDKAKVKYQMSEELKTLAKKEDRIDEKELTTAISKVAKQDGDKLVKIITQGDEKVCEKCKPWEGKIVSLDGKDKRYKSVQEFIDSDGLHINCRCSLQEIDVTEIPRKPPNPRAYNDFPIGNLVFG